MSELTKVADEFRAANEEAIAFAAGCSPEQWRALVPEENWTVAALLHHLAYGHELGSGWIETLRRGEDIPGTGTEIDERNARDAVRYADADRDETVRLLRDTGSRAQALLRSLSEDELAREGAFGPGNGRRFTLGQLIRVLPAHVRTHLPHAQTAAGAQR